MLPRTAGCEDVFVFFLCYAVLDCPCDQKGTSYDWLFLSLKVLNMTAIHFKSVGLQQLTAYPRYTPTRFFIEIVIYFVFTIKVFILMRLFFVSAPEVS